MAASRRWADIDLRPHGTTAAYKRHYRRGEQPCEACRQAQSRYNERRNAKRAAQREAQP